MEVKATAKTLRIQPRKARLVLNFIRGKSVEEAEAICKFTPNKGGYLVGKVLHSAIANAVNNEDLDESNLYVKACWADEGITLKRYMPRAKGSASAIHKRTSHITVVVAEKEQEESNGTKSKPRWNASWSYSRLAIQMVGR